MPTAPTPVVVPKKGPGLIDLALLWWCETAEGLIYLASQCCKTRVAAWETQSQLMALFGHISEVPKANESA